MHPRTAGARSTTRTTSDTPARSGIGLWRHRRRCNREAVGAVLGGVVDGAIGSQVVKGEGRAVAIVVGSVLGAVIGAKIGRELDETDRGCIGHALELAADGKPVASVNPQSGLSYAVTPTRGFKQNGRSCRELHDGGDLEGRKGNRDGPRLPRQRRHLADRLVTSSRPRHRVAVRPCETWLHASRISRCKRPYPRTHVLPLTRLKYIRFGAYRSCEDVRSTQATTDVVVADTSSR